MESEGNTLGSGKSEFALFAHTLRYSSHCYISLEFSIQPHAIKVNAVWSYSRPVAGPNVKLAIFLGWVRTETCKLLGHSGFNWGFNFCSGFQQSYLAPQRFSGFRSHCFRQVLTSHITR